MNRGKEQPFSTGENEKVIRTCGTVSEIGLSQNYHTGGVIWGRFQMMLMRCIYQNIHL